MVRRSILLITVILSLNMGCASDHFKTSVSFYLETKLQDGMYKYNPTTAKAEWKVESIAPTAPSTTPKK